MLIPTSNDGACVLAGQVYNDIYMCGGSILSRQWTLCDKAVASAWRARRTLVTARMLLVAEGPDRIGALLVQGRAIHALSRGW